MVLADRRVFTGSLGSEPNDLRLRVWAACDEGRLEVGTEDGETFSWRYADIGARVYDTCTVELHVDGTSLFFAADDPLRFADELSDLLAAGAPSQMTERPRRSVRISDPLDRRTTIPVVRPEAAPPSRRSVDRDRLAPLGPKGKLRRPKQHAHEWQAAGASYGFSRAVCTVCRQVTIDLTGPAVTSDVGTRPPFRDFLQRNEQRA